MLPLNDPASLKRVAFSPGEFAELFGKSQTWGYRQIYAGKVKTITEHGRILIPAAEVEAILKTAGVYNGMKPKAPKTKAELQSLGPKLRNAWQQFLSARRQTNREPKVASKAATANVNWPESESARQAALSRLTQKGKPGKTTRE